MSSNGCPYLPKSSRIMSTMTPMKTAVTTLLCSTIIMEELCCWSVVGVLDGSTSWHTTPATSTFSIMLIPTDGELTYEVHSDITCFQPSFQPLVELLYHAYTSALVSRVFVRNVIVTSQAFTVSRRRESKLNLSHARALADIILMTAGKYILCRFAK